MKKKVYRITEETKYDLLSEIKDIKENKLKAVADELESTRNEEFSEDDAELGRFLEEKEALENRVREIEDILENCEIVKDKDHCSPNDIRLGSKLKVKQGSKTFEVRLVSSIEADPTKNFLSDRSPLGRALLKSKVGETVKVKIRGEVTEYKILEVC